jgi:hypothetical protein
MFQESLLLTLLLAWLIATGASGLLLHKSGKAVGRRLAELGIGIGFLAAYIALAGGLPWFDDLPDGAVGTATSLILLPALLLALWGPRPGIARWPILLVVVLTALFLVGGRHFVFASTADIAEAAIGAIAGMVIVLRLERMAEGGGGVLIVLAVIAVAAGGIAWFGAARFFAELFFGFAAALLGLAVWAWPLQRWSVGPAALLIGSALLLTLSLAFWRNAVATPWVLPLAGLALWSDRIARDVLGFAQLYKRKPLRTYALVLASLIPAVLAVLLAALTARWHPVS